MAGIVEGLFGVQPWQAQQQMYQGLNQDAYKFAQLEPLQQATMGMYQGGGMLAGAGAEAFGLENPAVRDAKMREAALQGLDPSNPQSILERAAQIQDPRLKMQLTMLARQITAENQKEQMSAAKMRLDEARAARETAMAERALRGEPDMKYAPEIQKLISLRDSLPENDPRRQMVEAAIRKATYVSEPKSLEDIESSKIKVMEEKERIKAQSAQAKQQTDDAKSFKWLDKKFSEIENAMADSLGVDPNALEKALTSGKGSAEQRLDRAVGFIDAMIPALTQQKANILSHIERLKSLGQTGGLAELRAAGVAPGSITEREWPKFQADLANIDTSLGAPELLKQYLRIYQKISDARTRGKEAIGAEPKKQDAWQASTPDEVRALFKSGKITRDEAKAILKDMGI